MAFLSALLALLTWMGVLLQSCHSKAKPEPTRIVIYADTTRAKLVHRADSSSQAVTILTARSTQSVTTYEKSKQTFDSIQIELP